MNPNWALVGIKDNTPRLSDRAITWLSCRLTPAYNCLINSFISVQQPPSSPAETIWGLVCSQLSVAAVEGKVSMCHLEDKAGTSSGHANKIKTFSPLSPSSVVEMFRRRTGCRCWRSTGSTRGSRPNSASWRFSSANRIPPNPSRPALLRHPLSPHTSALIAAARTSVSRHHTWEGLTNTPNNRNHVTWLRRDSLSDVMTASWCAAFMSRRN